MFSADIDQPTTIQAIFNWGSLHNSNIVLISQNFSAWHYALWFLIFSILLWFNNFQLCLFLKIYVNYLDLFSRNAIWLFSIHNNLGNNFEYPPIYLYLFIKGHRQIYSILSQIQKCLNGGVAWSDLYNKNNRINLQIQAKLSHLPINHKEGEVSLTLQ